MASSCTSKANSSITNHTPPITPTNPSHPHTSTHSPANGQHSQVNLTQRPMLISPEPAQSSRSGSKSAATGNGEQGQQKKKRGRPKGSPNKPKHDPSQPPPKPEPKPLGRPLGAKDKRARNGYHWKLAEKEANRIARAAALAARQNTQRRQPRKIAGRRQQPLPSFIPAPNTPLGHASSPISARRPARRPAAPSPIATNEARPLVHVQPIPTQPQNIYNGNEVQGTRESPSQLEIGSDNNYGNLEHMGISNDQWDITMQPDQPVQNQQTAAPQHYDPANPAFHDANLGGPAPWQLASAAGATAPAAHDALRTVPIAQQPHEAYNNSFPYAGYLHQIAPATHHTAHFAPMAQQPHEAYDNSTNGGVYTWQPPLWFQAQQALHRYLNGLNLGPHANGFDFFKHFPIELLATLNEQQPFEGAYNYYNNAPSTAPMVGQPIKAYNNYNAASTAPMVSQPIEAYNNYNHAPSTAPMVSRPIEAYNNYNHAASTAPMVSQPIEAYNNYNNAGSTAPMIGQPIEVYNNYNDTAPTAHTMGQPIEAYNNDAAVQIAPVVWQSIDAPHNNDDAGPIAPMIGQPIEAYNNDAPIAPVVWQPIDAPHDNNNNDAAPNPPVVWQPIDTPYSTNANANDTDTEMTWQEESSITDEEVGSLDFEIDAFLDVDGNLAKCFTE